MSRKNHFSIEAPDTTGTVDLLSVGANVTITIDQEAGEIRVTLKTQESDDDSTWQEQEIVAPILKKEKRHAMSKFTRAVSTCPALYVGANPEQCDQCEGCSDERTHEFSSYGCESCNGLPGERYAAHDDNGNHYDICPDCVQWHANGEEPQD